MEKSHHPIRESFLGLLGRVTGGKTATIRWQGRKSGKRFSTTVWIRETPEGGVIRVGKPASKTWWRNFRGDGWPIEVAAGDHTKRGHGVANGEPPGKVTVNVRWEKSAD